MNEDWMREKQPFAVVGCNRVIKDGNGRNVKGRKYPWGTVDVENKVTQTKVVHHHRLLFLGPQ